MPKLVTASGVISFSTKLEKDAACLYEALADRHPGRRDLFLQFARENRRFAADIERAYYSVISDAIEGCFAFDIESDGYATKTAPAQGMSEKDVVAPLLDMERMMLQFDLAAAAQSKATITDVSRAFQTVARKRSARIASLGSAP